MRAVAGTADGRFRLKRLEVEGFRGVSRKLTLDFAPTATLLFAANGQGKTSLLAAIEWCLFGQLPYQPAENLAREELVNLHHPGHRATVRLRLERDGETVGVERGRLRPAMAGSRSRARGFRPRR